MEGSVFVCWVIFLGCHEFGCHYCGDHLPGKTLLKNVLLCIKWDVKLCLLTDYCCLNSTIF